MRLFRCLLIAVVLMGSAHRLHALDEAPYTVRLLKQVVVFREPSRRDRPVVRIHFGAVLRAVPIGSRRGCASGWLRLVDVNGYICSDGTARVEQDPSPSERDQVDPDPDLERWTITRNGAVVFRNHRAFRARQRSGTLRAGSVLTVRRVLEGERFRYLVTSRGEYIQGDHAVRLNPLMKLGVHPETDAHRIRGFVVADSAPVRKTPDETGAVIAELSPFAVVSGAASESGFVRLSTDGYVDERYIALYRPHTPDFEISPNERWIAVDLEQQVLTAYEGNRPVLIVPCSTGEKGNTGRGTFRIQWKRRLQTLNPYGGRLRVEDVPWVMYYISERGFAIHTAFHDRFGQPVSQGCVNVPEGDARWLYEWASPLSSPFDSENFDTRFERGTRVVVF